jgi:hypothetical protein
MALPDPLDNIPLAGPMLLVENHTTFGAQGRR